MKKIIALLMTAALLILTVSCAATPAETSASTTAATEMTVVTEASTAATEAATTEPTTEATTESTVVVKPKTSADMGYGSIAIYSEYHEKDITYPYRVYYPTGYNAETADQYPLFIFLHGYGEVGTNNVSQLTVAGVTNQLLEAAIARDDCIVLAPQCPHISVKVRELKGYVCTEWVCLGASAHEWSTGSRETLPDYISTGMRAAMQLLDDFIATGKVDTTRVYIAGISMGGYGTWELITRRPDLFAAAVPICGSGFPSYAESLKDIAIWAFHGTADPTVPCQGTRDMESALTAAGGNVKATYFNGVGHDCWNNVFAYTDEIIDWMFSQHR